MKALNLNTLVVLDALLEECSVTGAAKKLGLSAPSVSRSLSRIRLELGDPILVRAGRRLVPTPHALALRDRVRGLVEEASELLRPKDPLEMFSMTRTFVVRASDGLASAVVGPLVKRFGESAPNAVLRFTAEGGEDVDPLRDGEIDLDIGMIGHLGPEVRVEWLFDDRFVIAVRKGHPLVTGEATLEQVSAYPHVNVSRRGRTHGPLDGLLQREGLNRRVSLVVASFYVALEVASASDFVAVVPSRLLRSAIGRFGLAEVDLPISAPVAISQAWHPRMDADPAHRWLRHQFRDVCHREMVG
ncbi:LysR family transcriptional regulator [Amycolatopsis sp. QT-25]|uniref:LysR family transcriptional regulator n=1 Tax=Amycolatopsis sp. QT-25 TaxID=3034022 RepID=UPI0023ED899C|nr:LysR family transcriptional regulator [Amycolatopsis sp. QT-25]WET76314.1 LysR family transcriptional regulator [Amycolatopsis sp. QT-25]